MRKKLIQVLGLILASSPVLAKESALEEIVVTAQKREQNIMDVPVAVSVLTNESLEASGVTEVRDLAIISPSINYQSGVSSSNQNIRIRGVGGGAFASGFESSVGTMIDGVVTGPGGASLSEFWDVDRVEVLRGPQGTLFGKNTSAGIVNIYSKRPTREFEAEAKMRWGDDYDELRFEGMVSGPLSENLAGRFAGFWYDQDEGNVDNIVLNDTENRKERWGARFSTAYENGPLSVNLSLSYVEQDNTCCARVFAAIDEDVAATSALSSLFVIPLVNAYNLTPGHKGRKIIQDHINYENVENFYGVLEVSYELESGHIIKSITGYKDWDQDEFNDVDVLPVDIIGGRVFHTLDLFTQEIQLLSPAGNNLEYVLGLYYYDSKNTDNTFLFGGTTLTGGIFGSTGWDSTVNTENMAVFGHVTYKFNEQWSAYLGGRFLSEDIDARGVREGNFFAFPGVFASASASGSDDDWVGTAGVKFYPREETMLYASVSRGYKGSAIDTTIGSTFFTGNPESTVLNPETVINYELGLRTSMFDGRLSLSATAFMSEFEDFQATAFLDTSYVLRNAGTLESNGFELEASAIPWEGGRLIFNMAYIDATFDEYKGAPCQAAQVASGACPVGGQDLSGQQLNNSSEWQYTVNLKQEFTLGEMQAFAIAEYAWRDDVIFDGDLDPNTAQDAYGIANFRLGITAKEKYEFSIFARNAFDEEYMVQISDAPLYSGVYGGYPGLGRSVGIELRMSY